MKVSMRCHDTKPLAVTVKLSHPFRGDSMTVEGEPKTNYRESMAYAVIQFADRGRPSAYWHIGLLALAGALDAANVSAKSKAARFYGFKRLLANQTRTGGVLVHV